ncbi:hypothetical protein MMC07_009857 [Pseudocyphellaria aurata]|nr:hypothetical protein [Pseudocyphellaria aurata]
MSDPSQSVPPSRFLHIYVEGLINRRIIILDSDKTTPVYLVDSNGAGLFSSKPDLCFYLPPTPSSPLETQIGSATFHSWSSTIDLQFGSSVVSLESTGSFTRSAGFQSSVGPLTWQHDSAFGDDLQLVNASGEWLARFVGASFSIGKRGTLEISGGIYFGPGLLDEIVISGIVMVEEERRRRRRR